MITARLANAHAAAATAAAEAQVRAGVPPTTADGLNTMTPAQQRRAIEKRARELEAARRAAERERKAQERATSGGRAPAAEDDGDGDPDRRPRRHLEGRAVADPRRVRHDLRHRPPPLTAATAR